jgi:type II secretory pathway component PulF
MNGKKKIIKKSILIGMQHVEHSLYKYNDMNEIEYTMSKKTIATFFFYLTIIKATSTGIFTILNKVVLPLVVSYYKSFNNYSLGKKIYYT